MRNLLFLSLFFWGMGLASCGGGGSEPSSENPDDPSTSSASENRDADGKSGGGESTDGGPKNLADAMKQATKALEDAGMGQKVEVVNFRDLQKHLPENLAGMERISKGGETAGALGMKISNAEAKFKTDDGTIVEITLSDTGGLGMGLLSMASWSTVEIDKEDENGSERTTTLDGYKSYETTRKRDNSCELAVIAEDRYIATAKCKECKMEQLKKAVRAMGLGDLPKGEKK